jgi:hypothetical protein
MRPLRSRTDVKTYDFKMIPGIDKIRRRRRKPQGETSISEAKDAAPGTSQVEINGTSQAAVLNFLEQDDSGQSSRLPPPTLPPSQFELEKSLSHGKVGTMEHDKLTGSQTTGQSYDCFNPHVNPKGHFYSANQLYARGVWIGYLASNRQSKSFRGLPSFNTLKSNHAKEIQPCPPAIEGSVGQARPAICRGCFPDSQVAFELREVQFSKATVSCVPEC